MSSGAARPRAWRPSRVLSRAEVTEGPWGTSPIHDLVTSQRPSTVTWRVKISTCDLRGRGTNIHGTAAAFPETQAALVRGRLRTEGPCVCCALRACWALSRPPSWPPHLHARGGVTHLQHLWRLRSCPGPGWGSGLRMSHVGRTQGCPGRSPACLCRGCAEFAVSVFICICWARS